MNTNEAIFAKLKAAFPQLGLSYGYIGNCGMIGRTYVDDRSWRIFTSVRINADDVNCAQVYLGDGADGGNIDEVKATHALNIIAAQLRASVIGYKLSIKLSTPVQIMDGKPAYTWGFHRIGTSYREAQGEYATASEAADAIK
jgi:hypothetical protein